MLVISRGKDERVFIDGDRIQVQIIDIRGDKVRLGISAPKEVSIHREEIWIEIQRQEAERTTATE